MNIGIIILVIQSIVIIYYLMIIIFFLIKKKLDLLKFEKINMSDEDIFKYYRDILKDYSIGELRYLFNGKKQIKLAIMAELEYLKIKKNINIDDNNIVIINKDNISKSERYILEHYKFINDREFKEYYRNMIETSLKEKECINKYNYKPKNIFSFSIFFSFILFVISHFLFFYLLESNTVLIDDNLFLCEFANFFLFGLIGFCSFYVIVEKKLAIKTKKGNDIYLKLKGLKNFIKDFGFFDDKTLEEITLWQEYILYAIILDESKSLTKESKDEFKKLVDIIYKYK